MTLNDINLYLKIIKIKFSLKIDQTPKKCTITRAYCQIFFKKQTLGGSIYTLIKELFIFYFSYKNE